MPLSPPASRLPVHTRRIETMGWRRGDGLWDIEGYLVDTKSYAFPNAWRGSIASGEPVHEMRLRLTIDDRLVICAAEACTETGPYPVCNAAAPAFAALAGLRIGPGWTRTVKKLLGGRQGCTHLLELLGPMATTAIQTVFPLREKQHPADPAKRPPLLDTCHALTSDGAVALRRWPNFYTGDGISD